MRATKAQLLERLAQAEAKLARMKAKDVPMACDGPSDAAAAIRALCHPEQESFVVMLFDSRQRVLAIREAHRGHLTEVDVHPREVFRDAIRMCARAIIVGHNHPSGTPEPSVEDIRLTLRLRDCGVLLGIPVLDHVIVTDDDHVSLAARGYLDEIGGGR